MRKINYNKSHECSLVNLLPPLVGPALSVRVPVRGRKLRKSGLRATPLSGRLSGAAGDRSTIQSPDLLLRFERGHSWVRSRDGQTCTRPPAGQCGRARACSPGAQVTWLEGNLSHCSTSTLALASVFASNGARSLNYFYRLLLKFKGITWRITRINAHRSGLAIGAKRWPTAARSLKQPEGERPCSTGLGHASRGNSRLAALCPLATLWLRSIRRYRRHH